MSFLASGGNGTFLQRLRSANMHAYFRFERRIAPGTRYSQIQYEERLRDALEPGIRWLDVGCGHRLLPSWRASEEQRLVSLGRPTIGIDPDLGSLQRHRSIRLRVNGNVMSLPFRDGSFDIVTANMVVEHLDRPEAQFAEILRVLRPGGRLLFHTPNAAAYPARIARAIPESWKAGMAHIIEGRRTEDVFPTFYRANTVEGIAALSSAVGFDVESIEPTTTSAMLSSFLPLAIIELLWIRALETPRFARWRQVLIVALRRPPAEPGQIAAHAGF